MNANDREAEILRLFPLVRSIARAVRRRNRLVEYDDCIGDGSLGLVAAVDTYDASRGMSIECYARRKILYAMLDGARRTDDLTRIARYVLESAERDRYALALELGRMPTSRELECLHPKLRSMQLTASLRRPLPIPSGEALEHLSTPDWQSDPAAIVCAREMKGSVSSAIRQLPARHRAVLGLCYARGYRLADVARRLSLTAQRVAQLRDRALETVRQGVRAS